MTADGQRPKVKMTGEDVGGWGCGNAVSAVVGDEGVVVVWACRLASAASQEREASLGEGLGRFGRRGPGFRGN